MPLLVGASLPTPPVPAAPSDELQLSWTAPNGTVWQLTSPLLGWHVLNAVSGWGAAPVALATDPYPRGGAKVRHVQPQPRLITLPLRVTGTDEADFRANWRALVGAFTQTRRLGPGILTVIRPDGTSRLIYAYYQDGFAGTQGEGWLYDTAVLTLYCEDPYWRDVTPTVIRREQTAADSVDYLNPYPSVSSSQTLGVTTAHNPGEVEAWPTWTITGPSSGVSATNNTTDESFNVDPNATGIAHGNLLAGEVVTITTDPPAIRGPDGSVWTAALNFPSAVLWGLQPGDNDVAFTLTGSSVGSSVELSFVPRHETA